MRKALPFVLVFLVGGLAHAALTDSYGARRVTRFQGECPEATALAADVCTLNIIAVRPLTPTAAAEAAAANIPVASISEGLAMRTITRAQLSALINASNPAP